MRGAEHGHRTSAADVSVPASLLANATRASIVLSLMEEGTLSAGDLASRSGVSGSAISGHLAKLTEGGLVVPGARGRHRFFRLAGPSVGDAVAALASVSPSGRLPRASEGRGAERLARTCYDHLAGRLGVRLTDALLRDRRLSKRDRGYGMTRSGAGFFRDLGLNLPELRSRRRAFSVGCMDGTERQPHLGGALGAGLADRLFELGWLRPAPDGRAVRITPEGRGRIRDRFGVDV